LYTISDLIKTKLEVLYFSCSNTGSIRDYPNCREQFRTDK
jgi:hypothetical protein